MTRLDALHAAKDSAKLRLAAELTVGNYEQAEIAQDEVDAINEAIRRELNRIERECAE